MARVLEGTIKVNEKWKATIRCAHPSCGFGLYRVDGCFALIEIELDDIQYRRDYEGDETCWVVCPACGQTLYPEWQIGAGPIRIVCEPHRRNRS